MTSLTENTSETRKADTDSIEMLTITEAIEEFPGVTRLTIRQLITQNKIRYFRTGKGNNVKPKVHQMTWNPNPCMTDKQIEIELNRQVVMFKQKIKSGIYPCNVTFMALAEDYRKNTQKHVFI